MSHPIEPDAETTWDVFQYALSLVARENRDELMLRWNRAKAVENRRRAYDADWERSLHGTARYGQ